MNNFAIIGLDCADPKLMFEEFWEDLPNIRKLAEGGSYGPLQSTIPPITVPAWMSMMTGKDPGTLGFYGFRNRKDYSYDSVFFANSRLLKHEPVWDTLGKKGYKSIVLGVPLTYPPKPINGYLVTSFLTPSIESNYTYPKELKEEIKSWVGKYMLDVENFRTEDKQRILDEVYEMTEKRFEVAKHLVTEKEWNFFMMVEMGPDRLHHAFWAYHDPTHFKHDPTSPFRTAIKDYYIYLDKKIGELVQYFPEDTTVMLVSDHGIQKMEGGIAINDWLTEKGYLVLKEKPEKPTRIGKLIAENKIDWSKTKAWGMGGYYGRLFINVKEREPEGIVPKEEYEDFRNQLIKELEAITDEHGNNIGTKAFKPEEVYSEINNIAPDLIIYFGNLTWRSMGSVGNPSIWTHENDTGPDDANHAQDGMVLMNKGQVPRKIYEVRDAVLRHFEERD
ncbi:MAG TPA: phosphodiesterase [Thermotogaceae bacterium]|nr:phosphodiesterase [Thermotogaceae bacterium]